MASSSDDLHLSFRLSGGWRPKALEWELDERRLSPEEAGEWAAVVQSGTLERGAPEPVVGVGGDQQQYELTVHRGDHVQVLRFDEFNVPAELAGLVRILERHAEELERLRAAEVRRGRPGP